MLASAVIAAGALAACGRNDKTVGELIDPDAVFRDRRDRCLAVTADSLQPPRETISIEGESSQGAGATRAVVVDSIERYDVTYYGEMGRTHQWFAVAGDSLLCGAQHE